MSYLGDGPMRQPSTAGGRYLIRLHGELDPSWSEWLGGLDVVWDVDGNTQLCGDIADHGALHGILTRIRDLGLPLLHVERLQ